MKTFLKIAGGFIFLLIMAALIAPLLLNPNSYKSEIVTQIEQHIGRQVTIDGDVRLRLLPLPRVKVKDIKVASVPGAKEPYFATIGGLTIHLQLWPLLRGHIDIKNIKLERARLVLEELPNKTVNWEFPEISNKTSSPMDEKNQQGKGLHFDIQKLQLKESEVIYLTAQSRQEFKNINLDIDLDTLQGPYKLNGKVDYLDQQLAFDGKIGQLANFTPADLALNLFGQHITLNGQVDTVNKGFEGIIRVKGDTRELQKILPALKISEPLLQRYKVKSKINLTTQKITARDIELLYGNVSSAGNANVDLGNLQAQAHLQINPGRASLIFTSQPKPDLIFNGSVTLTAQDLEPLLNAFKVQNTGLVRDLSKSVKLAANISYGKDQFTLSNIVYNQGKAQLQGTFSQRQLKNKPRYQYEFKTPNFLPLMKIFMPDFNLDLGAVALKGEISGPPEDLKTQTHLMAAHTHVAVQGEVKIKDPSKMSQFSYNLALAIDGPNLKSTLASLNIKLDQKNLGKFNIATNLKGDMSRIKLQNLKGEVATRNSTLSWDGVVEASRSPLRPKISATLALGHTNLSELLAEVLPHYWDLLDKVQIFTVSNNNHAAQGQALPKHSSHWSHEKIDLGFLKMFDGDFKITASKIEYGSFVFQNMHGSAKLVNGILEIPQLNAETFGGTATLKARISSQQGQPINFKLNMTGANLKELAPQQGKITIARGNLNLNADLNTVGGSEYEYVKNLSGTLALRAQNGAINGFNLKKIHDQLGHLNNLNAVLKLLNTSFEGGQTPFSSFDGLLSIQEGIARITQMNLIAEGATAHATGKINLPSYTLNSVVTVKLSETKFPPFGVRFFGSLEEPQHELDIGELQKYLLQHVFRNVIEDVLKNKKKPAAAIQDILGLGRRRPAKDASEPQTPPQQPPIESQPDVKKDPKKAIESIIKGLF